MTRPLPGRRPARCAGDGGVVIVEVAFVLPLLFLLVFGLFDFGLWEFQNSQASGGARDGARAGIVQPLATDPASSTAAVEAAVRARLARDTDYPGFTIQAYCEGGGGSTIATSCAGAQPGVTRLVVKVGWDLTNLSFVGDPVAPDRVTGTAKMLWEGTRGPNPGSDFCAITNVLARTPIPSLAGGALSAPLYVDFTTNGSAACTSYSADITLVGNATPTATGSVTVSGTTGTATFAQGTSGFVSGTYEVGVTGGGLTSYVAVPLADANCTVSSIDSVQVRMVSPPTSSTIELQNKNSHTLKRDLDVTFTAQAACAGVAATVDLQKSDGVTSSGPIYTVAIPNLIAGKVTIPKNALSFDAGATYQLTFRWGPNVKPITPFPVIA